MKWRCSSSPIPNWCSPANSARRPDLRVLDLMPYVELLWIRRMGGLTPFRPHGLILAALQACGPNALRAYTLFVLLLLLFCATYFIFTFIQYCSLNINEFHAITIQTVNKWFPFYWSFFIEHAWLFSYALWDIIIVFHHLQLWMFLFIFINF